MTAGGGESAAAPRRGRAFLGALGAFALGAILLVAAFAKVVDPQALGEEIARQKLALGLPVAGLALAALAIEAGLGALLVLNVRRTGVLVAATLLVAFFLFLTGRQYWRAAHGELDPGAGCGCFGNLVERTPAEAFWQDLLMLGPALALAWVARSGARRGLPLRVATAMFLACGTAVFGWRAPSLPLDDFATRLKPGIELAKHCGGRDAQRVCLDQAAPSIASGDHYVVIADPRAPGFGDLVGTLNRYAASGRQPPLTVLAELTPAEQQKIFWTYAPGFDLVEVPGALLRPLYRRLPRAFRVRDGRVTETWAGLPPFELLEQQTPVP
ncbi:MAG: hypothetical protein U0X73_16530 [Thermoanaerobaculia bacterium]